MPRGIPNKKPELTEVPDPQDMTPPAEGVRLAAMLLHRHYRPRGYYEIVGHHTKEVVRKRASGEQYVAEPSVFVPSLKAPPPFPGVGFADKIWAGTIIRLPEEEAKAINKAGIGERSFED